MIIDLLVRAAALVRPLPMPPIPEHAPPLWRESELLSLLEGQVLHDGDPAGVLPLVDEIRGRIDEAVRAGSRR